MERAVERSSNSWPLQQTDEKIKLYVHMMDIIVREKEKRARTAN